MTTKHATSVAFECPTCNRTLEPGAEDVGTENLFDVHEASSDDHRRKEASGFWMIERAVPMLVAESWEDDNDFVQAVVLNDYDEPGFTIVEFADAKQLGKARVRVDERERGDASALLGQLYVRNGHAGISYLAGWHNLCLLQVPLADAEAIEDGDYGFSWSLECSSDGKQWTKVYEADPRRSWLNKWRPADSRITDYFPQQLDDLPYGLIPPQ